MEPGATGPPSHIETLLVPVMHHIIFSGDRVHPPETISTALDDKFFCISATRRTSCPLESSGGRGGLSVHLGALSLAETSFSAGLTASRMKWVPDIQLPLLFDLCQRSNIQHSYSGVPAPARAATENHVPPPDLSPEAGHCLETSSVVSTSRTAVAI